MVKMMVTVSPSANPVTVNVVPSRVPVCKSPVTVLIDVTSTSVITVLFA